MEQRGRQGATQDSTHTAVHAPHPSVRWNMPVFLSAEIWRKTPTSPTASLILAFSPPQSLPQLLPPIQMAKQQ